MTTPSRDDIIGAAANGGLLDLIFKDSWRYDSAPFSQALIDAHNANEVDLRALLPLPELSWAEGNDRYHATEILLPALGSLATSCADLLELMAGAIPQDDPMLSHSSYTVIMNWCQASQVTMIGC